MKRQWSLTRGSAILLNILALLNRVAFCQVAMNTQEAWNDGNWLGKFVLTSFVARWNSSRLVDWRKNTSPPLRVSTSAQYGAIIGWLLAVGNVTGMNSSTLSLNEMTPFVLTFRNIKHSMIRKNTSRIRIFGCRVVVLFFHVIACEGSSFHLTISTCSIDIRKGHYLNFISRAIENW